MRTGEKRKGDLERAQEVAQAAGLGDHDCASVGTNVSIDVSGESKLNLGAGTKRLPGYRHVDIVENNGIDFVYDLNQVPWPWADDSIAAIVAEDLVEHLEITLIDICNDAWRIMRPGGELFIRSPHHQGASSWIDPTHRWHLNEQAFHYLDPETYWGRTYPHYTPRKWRIVSLGLRGPQNIHAILIPRK